MILADPPYGDTSLAWDRRVEGWLPLAHDALRSTGSLWVFGSLRSFMAMAPAIAAAGLRYAQEVVWEKQNGTSFHADRFRRVHELIVQFYRADTAWADIYNDVQTTPDATARTVRRKRRPPHTGHIEGRPLRQRGRRPASHALRALCAELPRLRDPPDRETLRPDRNPDPHELSAGRPGW
ncbi:MAG: DNA methyltransferase [Acetobacteraceae bacterium]